MGGIVKLINRFNGQEVILTETFTPGERSLWRLRKRIRDFDTFARHNDMAISFLTITQSDKSIGEGYRWVTDVMHSMSMQFKRAGIRSAYVAVLEIQPKRYREKGVLAPHWHIAIASSEAHALPHASRENGRIKKVRDGSLITWAWLYKNIKQKFGMYFVCDCYSNHVYDYLGKYIAKGGELEDFKKKLGRPVRVFSGSRIPVQYQMSEGQSLEHGQLLQAFPDYADLYWRREDSRIVARAKSIQESKFLTTIFRKITYPKVCTIAGDWVVQESEWVNPNGGDETEKL